MAQRNGNQRKAVSGSGREPVRGAHVIGPVADDEQIDVTLRLRAPRGSAAARVYRAGARRSSDEPITREELSALTSAKQSDIDAVQDFASAHGLSVGRVSRTERTIHLHGPASAMMAAFGVTLERARVGAHSFRQRTGSVHIPKDLESVVTGVFGLDDRAQAHPNFRMADHGLTRARAAGAFNGYMPDDLSKAYNYPNATGKHQCIALIELGGGYRPPDLQKFFAAAGPHAPRVISVAVDGARNAPVGDPNSADGEVVLDIEVAGGIAPNATIAVYFAPNTDRGFLDAVTQAVHDNHLKPNVLSISWGAAETSWTQQSMNAMEEVFQEAAALGIPVFCAAGDDGARDGTNALVVDFPAASPSAIGCGGTRLEITNGVRTAETVWNNGPANGATGGGFSKVFPTLPYQKPYFAAGEKGRGVPDVAGNADPQTGYRIFVDGSWEIIGGTSAVAPLLAGLVARCNEKGKRSLRDLHALIYGAPAPRGGRRTARAASPGRRSSDQPEAAAESRTKSPHVPVPPYLFDVVQGNNNPFKARVGWDACTGLGVPTGSLLLQQLWNAPAGAKARMKQS